MNNESEVVQAFRKHVPKEMMWRRIEDASGSLGTWDGWTAFEGRIVFLEFKWTQTVKRKPKLRRGQMAFGHDLIKAKTPGYYICGSSDGNVRILKRNYDGEDWKSAIKETWMSVSKANVLGLLEEAGLKLP